MAIASLADGTRHQRGLCSRGHAIPGWAGECRRDRKRADEASRYCRRGANRRAQ